MEIKANLVTIVIIAGFTILLGFFAYSFSQNIERSSEETSTEIKQMVNQSSTNVTTAIDRMVDLKQDEVDLLSNLSNILQAERQTNKENLELFLGTFENQSESEVNATKQLEDKVVETLQMSQNLTQENMKVLQERNNLLKLQSLQFDKVITLMGGNASMNVTESVNNLTTPNIEETGPLPFNLTLIPNATVLAPGA